jgi:tetratricopeptide (TPR) repeat protein
MGPPEDDTVPAYPMALAPQRVAAMPVAAPQLVAPEPTYGQPEDEPALPALAAPAAVGTTRLAEVESMQLNEGQPAKPSWQEVLAAEPARSLRDLAEPDSEAIESYTASTTDLSRRLAPEVQAGFQLGKSGAVFAARAKFVEVLRRVAMAKDAAQSTTVYSEALADGLRTLDDADDFVPKGNTLEAELDVESIARSHNVQLASAERDVAPHEAVARYSQHAATRLAEAVAGEQAGSMALYGLGKTYDRLEAQSGDATAGRKSAVMYRAAVDAHGENYLAANELGVRLAKSGRYEQASRVLRRAASQPAAIAAVHANLAAVEQRLGNHPTAELARRHSEMLAQRERIAGAASQRHGVDWVDTQSFRQAPIEPAMAPPAGVAMASATPQQAAPSGLTSFWRTARKATGWQEPAPAAGPPSVPTQRVVR